MPKQGFFFDPTDIVGARPIPEASKRSEKRKGGNRRKSGPKSVLDGPATCETCKLFDHCDNAKMLPYGSRGLNIAIVGESPGREEEREGMPFIGPAGGLLRKSFRPLGVEIDDDCVILNAIQCRPNDKVTSQEVAAACCFPRVDEQIKQLQPELIIAFGDVAVKSLLGPIPKGLGIMKMRGRVIPSSRYGCWIACCIHPAYCLRQGEKETGWMLEQDIVRGLDALGRPVRCQLDPETTEIIRTFDQIPALEKFLNKSSTISFDYETTSLSPYQPRDDLVVLGVALSNHPDYGYYLPLDAEVHGVTWTDLELAYIENMLRQLFTSRKIKIVQNAQFEVSWTQARFGVTLAEPVIDTMLQSHVLDSRQGICGLDVQTFFLSGTRYKDEVDRGNLAEETLDSIGEYGGLDARYTLSLKDTQEPNLDGRLREANDFFHESQRTLIDARDRGIGIDVDILDEMGEGFSAQREDKLEKVRGMDCTQGLDGEFNPGSSKHVGQVLVDYFGAQKLLPKTATGRHSVAEPALEALVQREDSDDEIKEFVAGTLECRRLGKIVSTYVKGIKSCIHADGLLHPSFMLHTVETYRSSSEGPNFQNFPKRDPDSAKLRRAFVPHLGQWFVDIDIQGAEIRVMAMISKDELLIKQLLEGYDLHRYWASRLYECREQDVTKDQRFYGKNKFVFPLFYGSYYKTIAFDVDLPENHVKRVEQEFWDDYKGIAAWHDKVMDDYQTIGHVVLPTGFRRLGPLSRNQIFNTPIQGTSFHLLLAGMTEANQIMKKRKMKSGQVGQIHDSVLIDADEGEIEEAVSLNVECITKKRWDWQGEVPMTVECSIGPNWYDQEEIVF